MKKITLITMGQGNPLALKNTLESFKDVVDEIIFGDVLMFDEDRKIIEGYKNDFNLKIVKFPFNFIFQNGFSSILNSVASHATNDVVLYMNVGEAIDGEQRIVKLLNEMFFEHTCWAMDHATETHTWFRMYDKREVSWSGLLHEELVGNRNDCQYYLFRFKDTPKDSENKFKAKVYNDIKELCYFQQYINLVEHPEISGATNQGWIDWAKEQNPSMKERLANKGKRLEAFVTGDIEMYLRDIKENKEFDEERFSSNKIIHFQ